MRRREFVAGAAAGAMWAFGSRSSALLDVSGPVPSPPTDASGVIRVKLFGRPLVRLDLSADDALAIQSSSGAVAARSISFDAGMPRVLTADGRAQSFDGSAVSISGSGLVAAVASDASGPIARHGYAGALVVTFTDDGIVVVDVVDVETYVAATLAAEVSPSWHPQALQAQAIVARTYALNARSRSAKRAFDVTDDTSSQVYRGSDDVAPAFVAAALATAGQALLAGAEFAQVFYSAACGGHTAAVIELTGKSGPPYLDGIDDSNEVGGAYCSRAPYYQWKNGVAADALARALGVATGGLNDVVITERWPDGRVRSLRIASADGASLVMDGHRFYALCAGALGYKVVPSTLFDIRRDGAEFAISGHGLGHGVGLCQWGARGRADAGASAESIVRTYFPGTSLTPRA